MTFSVSCELLLILVGSSYIVGSFVRDMVRRGLRAEAVLVAVLWAWFVVSGLVMSDMARRLAEQ